MQILTGKLFKEMVLCGANTLHNNHPEIFQSDFQSEYTQILVSIDRELPYAIALPFDHFHLKTGV